ncbi:MAG TPA: prolyl oligopeptidase family serine peptidase [Armatimonadota bacterium]|nr:prolyl oligopeptidase family serine peptidase [Armatimonadota bacterium]
MTNRVLDEVVVGQTVEADEFHRAFEGHIGMNLHFPDHPDDDTGLMLLLHGWGGDYHQYDAYAEDWRNRYNCVMVQVQYRGSKDASTPYDFGKYQAIDVLRCMHRVRQQCKINDERIFGWGGSGGGNVILQCGKMAPNTFALIVEHAGITHPTNAADMEAGWDRPNRAGGWQGTALGGTKEYPEHEKLVRDPVHHADLFNTKVYVFHPDLDTTVGVQHGIQMAYALKAAGKDAVLELIEGGNHSSGGALDPNERSRKTSTEFYAGEDILTRRKSGPTDFDRREPVRLPVNDGMYYQVVYDVEDGLPRLEGPLED